jgi:hypothetical protein
MFTHSLDYDFDVFVRVFFLVIFVILSLSSENSRTNLFNKTVRAFALLISSVMTSAKVAVEGAPSGLDSDHTIS